MSATSEFSFKDILPKCRDDFNRFGMNQRKEPYFTQYSKYCNEFRKNINYTTGRQMNFDISCKDVLFYLNYIDNNTSKTKIHLEQSCKYFFYKLKDLVKSYGGSCGKTESCYKKIREKNSKITYTVDIPDTCLEYANNYNINDDIYTTFQNLEKLYDIHGKFEKLQEDCNSFLRTFNEYDRIFTECKKWDNNESIKNELGKFYDEYNKYHKKNIECKATREALHSSTEAAPVTDVGTDLVEAPVSNAVTDVWIDKGTGMGVFTVLLLIIMFILYKYTIFGSFLQSLVRMLRKTIFKKNSYHYNLTDSFDRTYNYSNENNYRIA
ncbi:variable surface protein, partial [Plasmodium gonderi]